MYVSIFNSLSDLIDSYELYFTTTNYCGDHFIVAMQQNSCIHPAHPYHYRTQVYIYKKMKTPKKEEKKKVKKIKK